MSKVQGTLEGPDIRSILSGKQPHVAQQFYKFFVLPLQHLQHHTEANLLDVEVTASCVKLEDLLRISTFLGEEQCTDSCTAATVQKAHD